jgi:hypothetical protein
MACGFFLWRAPVVETAISILLIALFGALMVLLVIALRRVKALFRPRNNQSP